MTKQENIISIVSEAVEKAWEGSSSAKEASEKYLAMLQQDDVLREEATRRHLERIAYLDVVAQPRGYRARLKRAAHQTVLNKGETSTPAVSLKNMAPAYAKDMFERWLLPNTGICLGDATSEDLEQAIMHETSRSKHHEGQRSFYSAIKARVTDDKVVRDVWNISEVKAEYEQALVE